MLLKPYMISRPVFIGFQGQERSSFALRSRLLPTGQLVGSKKISRHNEKYHDVDIFPSFILLVLLPFLVIFSSQELAIRMQCGMWYRKSSYYLCFSRAEPNVGITFSGLRRSPYSVFLGP